MYPPLSLRDASLTSPSEAPVPLLGHVPTPARHRGNHSSDFFRSFSGFSLEFHHMCLCLNSSWPVFLSQKLVMGWGRLRDSVSSLWRPKLWDSIHLGSDLTSQQIKGLDKPELLGNRNPEYTEKDGRQREEKIWGRHLKRIRQDTMRGEREREESPKTTAFKNAGNLFLRDFPLLFQ